MEQEVELIIIIQGDSVQAGFYPYTIKTFPGWRINWLVRVIWTPTNPTLAEPVSHSIQRLLETLQVSVEDFAPNNPVTPPSPYGKPSPDFKGVLESDAHKEMVWKVTGEVIAEKPNPGETYEWSYSIIVSSGDTNFHRIDPLVVISG